MNINKANIYNIRSLYLNNKFFFLRIILSFIIWIVMLKIGLPKGGRWVLNEQIFTGFEIANGNLETFKPGAESLYKVTTIYPYLQSLILGLLTKITNLRNLEFICISMLAPLLTVLNFNILMDLSFKINCRNNKHFLPKSIYIVLIASFFIFSDFYLLYASELKPDSLALIFLYLSFYFTFHIDKSKKIFFPILNYKRLILISICLFLSCSTKQQFFLPSVFICIYLSILSRSFKNMIILTTGPVLSLLIPSIIFKGYFSTIILSHAGRGIGGIYENSLSIITSIFLYLSVSFLIILLVKTNIKITFKGISPESIEIISKPVNFINKKIKLKEIYNKNFFYSLNFYVISVFSVFFISQLISTFNFGGNVGNFQVGAIPLLSLSIPLIFSLNEFDKKESYIDKCINISLCSLSFFSIVSIYSLIPINPNNNYFVRGEFIIPNLY